MATSTQHFNLIKPSVTDNVSVLDLNTNFENIDTIMYAIKQASMYASGDTYTPTGSGEYIAFGFLTNAQKDIKFMITLPKSLADITTITLSELKANIRSYSGSYVLSSGYVTGGVDMTSDFTITLNRKDDVNIEIVASKNSGTVNATNNSILEIDLNALTLSFT